MLAVSPRTQANPVANIITEVNSHSRKPGQEASRFKTDKGTGKLVIPEDDSDSDAPVNPSNRKGNVDRDTEDGNAYMENITSADGFTRTPRGTVKFAKDTKKRRRAEAEAEVVDGGKQTNGY